MMEFTRKFIDEEMDRLSFELDFNYYLIRRYDAMYDENPEAAETFGMQIGDIVDNRNGMTDEQFRDALCDPYDLILDIINGKARCPCRFC